MQRPSWSVIALGAACGFLAGVILTLVLGTADPGAEERTITKAAASRTVTTPAAPGNGGEASATTTVPSVVGERLDSAKDRVSRAQFEAEVDGGGILGVVIESNWEVVEQSPPAGTPLQRGSPVTLRIERR